MQDAIKTLKARVKEREEIILTNKEEKILIDEHVAKVKAESENTKAEMFKLQAQKTGMIAPKTSV